MPKKESEEAAPAATLLVHTLCLHCNSTRGPLRSRFYCLIAAQKRRGYDGGAEEDVKEVFDAISDANRSIWERE